MRYAIPTDWDGTSWRCVQLQMPDSDEWLWLLQGMLSEWKKGRIWDERTGVVLSAIGAGQQIWDRNRDLTVCADDSGGESCPSCGSGSNQGCGSGLDITSEEDMPCLNIADLIKIEDGILYAKNDCCEWEEVGSLERQTEPLPDDPLNPTDDPALTYYACGKAYAGARAVFDIVKEFFDEIDNFPWQWISHVENGAGLDLDNKWIIAGVNQALIMTGVSINLEDFASEDDERWARCQLYAMLDNTPDGATEEQFNDFRAALKSHAGFNPFVLNMWDYVFFALGWKDFNEITALGALDDTQNCDCPGAGIADPTESWPDYDWAHFWDFTKSEAGWVANNGLTVYATDQGWVDWAAEGTAYVKTAIKLTPLAAFEASTNFKRYWMLVHVGNGFNYSGSLVKLGTNNTDNDFYGASSPGGDPVTVGGDIVIDLVNAKMRLAADTDVRFTAEGHVDGVSGATDPDSFRVLAIAIAGDGADPFL